MEPVALLAAVTAGAGVVLIAMALAGSGQRSAATERLESYGAIAAAEPARPVQRTAAGDAMSHSVLLSGLNRLVESRDWGEEISREMARADLALKPIEFILLRISAILIAIAVCMLLGATLFPPLSHPLALLIAAVIGYFIPRTWIRRRQGARINAFNAQLADTVTLIANSLRSGSSFLQSVELAVRESEPPISTEFNRVVREVSLGLSLEQALNNLVRRVRSDDLELMATAVTIQYQVGGNLADILDTISFTIRERVRIKGEIRTLTAQQRLSGYVVGFLPVGILGLLLVISPKFVEPMFDPRMSMFGVPVGVFLLLLGGVMMLIGFAVIRRIVDIEV